MFFPNLGYASGFAAGVLSSLPVGVLGMIVVSKTIEEGVARAFPLAVTVALMDVLYCLAAMFGISLSISSPLIHHLLKITNIILVFFFGVGIIHGKSVRAHLEKILNKKKFMSKIFAVFLLYISSPMQIVFWYTVANIVHSFSIAQRTFKSNLFFSISVGIGAICFYFVLLNSIHILNINEKGTPSGIFRVIRKALGYSLVVAALIMTIGLFHDIGVIQGGVFNGWTFRFPFSSNTGIQ